MHVLTEKPVAITLQDADRMKAAEAASGKKLGVIFQIRYEKGVQQLRQMIREGRFGRIRYMLDSDVEWIDGSVHNHYHDRIFVEDTAEVAIRFKNGCIYSLYACNSYAADAPIYLEFQGEKGRCGLKQDTGFYETDGVYQEILLTADADGNTPAYWGSGRLSQIRDFYLSVINDEPVRVDVTEGRKTLEIVKGIYLSSLQGKRIYLPFEDRMYIGVDKAAPGCPDAC